MSGVKVNFSGKTVTQIYILSKQQKFNSNSFDLSSTSLRQLDYYYFRSIPDAHNDEKRKYFLQFSRDKIFINYK